MLDLRRLPAPEPLLRALAASESLPAGVSLVLLTPWLPVLVQLLEAQGLEAAVEMLQDETARIRVHRPARERQG